MERREEIAVSKLGKVKDGPVKVYEVYPSEDPGNLYKRLVSVDGKPLSAAELAKNDAVHQKHILARLNESPAQEGEARARGGQGTRGGRSGRSTRSSPRTTSRWSRREAVDGHPTILAVARAATELQGPHRRRQVDEEDPRARVDPRDRYQIVRVEIEALEDIGVGLGVIGKLYKGTVGEFERTKVNGEVWLPARARFTAKGRALFRKFAIDSVTEWWDYKKFSVSTTEETR